MIGRLRLWSSYVLFAYVTTHLLNHALGLISLRVIEGGRIWFVYLWQSLPGQVALYGALLVHFTLALWAVVRRRSFRLSPWEWAQLVLGSSIIPLAALHVFDDSDERRLLFRRQLLSRDMLVKTSEERHLAHPPHVGAVARDALQRAVRAADAQDVGVDLAELADRVENRAVVEERDF